MPFDDFKQMGIVEKIHYQQVKELKENGHCADCGSYSDLTIHHKDPDRLKIYDLDNMVVLCTPCHRLKHKDKKGRRKK